MGLTLRGKTGGDDGEGAVQVEDDETGPLEVRVRVGGHGA